MTPEQRGLVFDLALGRIQPADFEVRSGLILRESGLGLHLLNESLASCEADDVEAALLIAGRCGLTEDLVPVLCDLLGAPWHTRHEDIAHYLQELRDARSVPALALAATTRLAYLAYDDSHALARKCSWALADIGTPEAREALDLLSRAADSEVAGYARRRLERWDVETSRKGRE